MSATSLTLVERPDALIRQHKFLFEESRVPSSKPNPAPTNNKRRSKCQGVCHTPSDRPNKEIINLAEWEAALEEENEEKNQDERDHKLEETQEKVVEEA